jgi:hypothetical protein
MDSAKYLEANGDSVLFPFAVIQQLDYNCFSPTTASWIGLKIVIREDGMNLLFNKTGDTIKVNTLATLNDKWLVYHGQDSVYIYGTVTKIDTSHFLGIVDTVKTISFQAHNDEKSPLENTVNSLQIKISKNYGLVKTLNFYLFPNFRNDITNEQLEEYELAGLSNPKVGVQNLTWFEVFDFKPGDEMHILEEYSNWDAATGNGRAETDKLIYKYLTRTNYQDSMVYTCSRKQSIKTIYKDSSTFKFYHDTIKRVIKSDSLFDLLPGEPVLDGYDLFQYYMFIDSKGLSKMNPFAFESYGSINDSCFSMIMADGCLRDNTYIKGLGGPYYSCTNSFALGGGNRSLVYYKKNGTEWGSPLVVTGLTKKILSADIRVYPNPVREFIHVKTENIQDVVRFDITNLKGRIVKSSRIDQPNEVIKINDLLPGFYIYRIMQQNEVLKIGKLIIK